MAFHSGDKVRILANCSGCRAGEIGTLQVGNLSGRCRDELFAITSSVTTNDNGCSCQGNWELISASCSRTRVLYEENSYSEGIAPKKINTLSNMMKKFLDKDVQTLVKAGYYNSDLSLSSRGHEANDAITAQTNFKELVILAQADLDEEAKNK